MHRYVTTALILLSLLSMTLLSQTIVSGQAGFGPGATFAINPASFTTPGKVNALISLSDGRVLVGGSFIRIGNQPVPHSLGMMRNDGSLDPAFQADPNLQVFELYAAAIQSDKKIVIAGWFTKLPTPLTIFLLRLNPNGSLDDTFHTAYFNSQVYSVLVDGDKILVGGNFTAPSPHIARLNQDGTADATFNAVGSGSSDRIWSIAQQSSGKYIIAGDFASYNGTGQAGLARLNANGSLDTSFVPGGFQASTKVAVLKDNSVIVGGSNICGGDVFAWYTVNGTAKPALSVDPNLFQAITAFLPQPDGGFLIGGWRSVLCVNGSPTAHEGQLWRYASDGTYQTMTSFGDESDVLALALRSDGKVLLGGQGRPKGAGDVGVFDGLTLLDLANNGLAIVPTFHPVVGDEATITTLSLYADGKLLVGGIFSHANGSPRFGVARLLANGALDTSFTPFADKPGGWSQAVLALPDGRAVAGFRDSELYLIGQGGSLTDLSAINGFDRVSALALQADNKILVGSDFGRVEVKRLLADFSAVDSTFSPGTTYGPVYTLAVQDDTKILVAGDFTKYNNIPMPALARVDSAGVLDAGFNPPAFMWDEYNTARLYSVMPLQNGKVMVGGALQLIGGVARPGVVRLNSNGTLDTGFTSPVGFNTIKSVCVQGDGSLWVGGIENASFRNPLAAHLSENGAIDNTFRSSYQGAHSDGIVDAVLCGADGLAWAGGKFSLINDKPFYGLARYFPLFGQVFLPAVQR